MVHGAINYSKTANVELH